MSRNAIRRQADTSLRRRPDCEFSEDAIQHALRLFEVGLRSGNREHALSEARSAIDGLYGDESKWHYETPVSQIGLAPQVCVMLEAHGVKVFGALVSLDRHQLLGMVSAIKVDEIEQRLAKRQVYLRSSLSGMLDN